MTSREPWRFVGVRQVHSLLATPINPRDDQDLILATLLEDADFIWSLLPPDANAQPGI